MLFLHGANWRPGEQAGAVHRWSVSLGSDIAVLCLVICTRAASQHCCRAPVTHIAQSELPGAVGWRVPKPCVQPGVPTPATKATLILSRELEAALLSLAGFKQQEGGRCSHLAGQQLEPAQPGASSFISSEQLPPAGPWALQDKCQ